MGWFNTRTSLGVVAFSISVVGCGGRAELVADARSNLLDRAAECVDATTNVDVDKVISLTHPNAIKFAGGEERMRLALRLFTTQIEQGGFSIDGVKLLEPTEIVANGRLHYAVVPYDVTITIQGQREAAREFVIAVSDDGGKDWRFVGGNTIREQPKVLDEILPEFPDELRPHVQ